MNTFHLHTIPLAEPVTILLPFSSGPRPRIVPAGGSAPVPEDGEETTFTELECAFWINPVTQTVHAQIARIANPLLLYSAEDFAAVAANLPEHHADRVMQILGETPAQALQALARGETLPSAPPRIPREIANWRARAVLEMAGLLPHVEAAIGAMTGPEGIVVRSAWERGAPLARRGATVAALTPVLGLSGEQVDAMFVQAESLSV